MRPTCYYRHWCHSCSFCDLILESCGLTRRVCREGVAPHSEVVVIGWDLGPWMYIMYISVFLKKHTSCKLYIDETLKKNHCIQKKNKYRCICNSLFDFKISHPNPFLFGDLYRCRMLTCGEYLILKGSALVLENYFKFVFQ